MQNLKPCLMHPCPNFAHWKGRCIEHQRPAFYTTNRKAELPSDWNYRREIVFQRDNGRCKCGRAATEVDHIIPGNDHDLDNLQAICTDCHRKKTSAEGNEAQRTAPVQWGTSLMEEYWRQQEAKKNGEG
jgi:5-methylcytosine-specific restriction endonuclease McrA